MKYRVLAAAASRPAGDGVGVRAGETELPERPEGCFAQNVPVTFFLRRLLQASGGGRKGLLGSAKGQEPVGVGGGCLRRGRSST